MEGNAKVFAALVIGVVAIIGVLVLPGQAVVILGFAATTIAAFLAYVQSRETHLQVNSRMDQLLEAATGKATAEATLAANKPVPLAEDDTFSEGGP
jgi:hypothetical protein